MRQFSLFRYEKKRTKRKENNKRKQNKKLENVLFFFLSQFFWLFFFFSLFFPGLIYNLVKKKTNKLFLTIPSTQIEETISYRFLITLLHGIVSQWVFFSWKIFLFLSSFWKKKKTLSMCSIFPPSFFSLSFSFSLHSKVFLKNPYRRHFVSFSRLFFRLMWQLILTLVQELSSYETKFKVNCYY